MTAPLVVLAVFSIGAGLLQEIFGGLVRAVLPSGAAQSIGLSVQAVAACVPLLGIALAALLYWARTPLATTLTRRPLVAALHGFLLSGWGFDRLYQALFVGPFFWLARVNRTDFIDLPFRTSARVMGLGSKMLVATQSGKVRWYVMGIALGGAVFIAMVVF